MVSNMIDRIKSRLPRPYSDKDDSKLLQILNAIAVEVQISSDNTDAISKMDNIDETLDGDLYTRWGSLLMVPRLNGDTEYAYRTRLKLAITSLNGGTMDTIRYSIAVGLNTDNTDNIYLYDGWDYTGDEVDPSIKTHGNIICIIDMNNGAYNSDIESVVTKAINDVKAAGVRAYISFYNYRVVYYIALEELSYATLSYIEYNKIGE